MVPGAGIEPARPNGRQILSLLCLPISPPGRLKHSSASSFEKTTVVVFSTMEASTGVEPVYVDLQSSA